MRRFVALLIATLLLVMQAGRPAMAGESSPASRSWQDESIYFLMTDRFYDGDPANNAGVQRSKPRAWHGGDLAGVLARLDYIRDLGFTAIWITPHVANTEWDYHGYGAVDFFAVDPHFGDLALLKRLVAEAHARDIRVIFDMVLNHTGPLSPLVKEHPDWFHPAGPITDWNDPVQLQEKWLFNLPDFDQSRPEVREYILSYSTYWIEQTGVDGFRIDTLRHLPPEFVRWYAAELQKIKPGFWLLGESWETDPSKLVVYREAGVPALLNFPVNEAVRFVIGNDDPMTKLAETVERTWRTMPPDTMMGGFVDNHDMERFVSVTWTDSVRRLKLALLFLLTGRDIPIIYSGTEVALEGGKDPDNRRDFPWGKESHPEVAALIRRLNRVRSEYPALRQGALVTLAADETSWAYGRGAYGEAVVVVLNNAEKQAYDLPVPVAGLGIADGSLLHDAITGREVTVRDGAIQPGLGPRSGAVFVPGPFTEGAPLDPWFSEPPLIWPWLSLLLMTAGFGAAFALWLWWRRRQSRLTTC